MNWFSKFFKKDDDDDFDFDFVSDEFPSSTLLRWFIYDVGVGDENALAEYLGLTRVSDEGNTKEQEDSDNRLVEIKEVFPYIDYISTISSDVITAAQLKVLRESPTMHSPELQKELEDDLKIMREIYRSVAATTLLGAISIGVRLGVLEQGGVALEEIDLEGDDNEF
jgi:hypothetical protein